MTGRTGVIRIVSGGQTGVDRAALDFAMSAGYDAGGWCPLGRLAEDGTIDARYPLIETDTDDYADRTARNVLDSDGTLIITRGPAAGGTSYTRRTAERLNKPVFTVDLDDAAGPEEVREWLRSGDIRRVNVAGPRESKCPGIYREAFEFLKTVLG